MHNITYIVRESKKKGFSLELGFETSNNNIGIIKRWNDNEYIYEAIGLAVKYALDSKNDYGNTAEIIIEYMDDGPEDILKFYLT